MIERLVGNVAVIVEGVVKIIGDGGIWRAVLVGVMACGLAQVAGFANAALGFALCRAPNRVEGRRCAVVTCKRPRGLRVHPTHSSKEA